MAREEYFVFAGIDWATSSHAVCVVSADGDILGEAEFSNNAKELEKMCSWITAFSEGRPELVAVGIEVPHGIVVDTLLDHSLEAYSINPRQLDRFRDRFSPSGAKDDARDALVLADSLRTDRRAYRKISPDLPEVIEIREMGRMQRELGTERIRLSNRIEASLYRYFPQMVPLVGDLKRIWQVELMALAPTPEKARKLRLSRLKKFVQEHHVRVLSAEDLLKAFREPTVRVSPSTVRAASTHIAFALERMRVVNKQMDQCNKMLKHMIDTLVSEPVEDKEKEETPEHHDLEILLSLPGVGRIVLAMLLGEAWSAIEARDYQALRALSGVAPVTRSSGNSRRVLMRRACNPRLREALYHWSRIAVQKDDGCKTRYATMRARGMHHAQALRSIANRLLLVAITMLKNGTLYDSGYGNRTVLKEAS